MLEAVLTASVINAYEERKVAIVDIPRYFIKDNQYETINLTLREKLAELMLKTASEVYRKYVVTGKGEILLYVQLLKALYGCLRSELLFYRKILAGLESRGFSLNQYYPCVVNKMICGKKFTITWHVENLKPSQVDKKVVDEMI